MGYEVRKKNNPQFQINLYKELFPCTSIENKKFYNIGAGSFYHPCWTNIDFYNNWYRQDLEKIGIHFDLMNCDSLPIESNSAEILYTSHVIEHITDKAIKNLFSEAYRILKSDGIFRITAPDINLLHRAFQNNDWFFFRDSINYYSNPEVMKKLNIRSMAEAKLADIYQYYFSATTSPLTKYEESRKIFNEELVQIFSEKSYEEALNYICSFSKFAPNKSGYHINWANASKVIRLLKQAGFSRCDVSAYGQSKSAILRDTSFFDNTVPEWSFYVEASK